MLLYNHLYRLRLIYARRLSVFWKISISLLLGDKDPGFRSSAAASEPRGHLPLGGTNGGHL
jgi:hypothetical protein